MFNETRVRSHADARYATLNHMQKSNTNRTWEIAIPNGTYQIHAVTGDAAHDDGYCRSSG